MRPAREPHIADILMHISQIARGLASTDAAPFAGQHLSRSQVETLFILAHSATPVTVGDIARRLSVTPGAVTQLLSTLREAELVEVSASQDDARVRIVALSESARSRVDAFERRAVERLAPRFESLDTAELRQLATLLGRLETPR